MSTPDEEAAEERAVWIAVYAAVVGGAVGGPHGFHYIHATSRGETGAPPYVETVSRSAVVYAEKAVADLRAARERKETR